MLEKESIEELKSKLAEYESIISEMTAPIIPSIIPETILVPITGILRAERFEKIRVKLLTYLHNSDVETAIIDFTDITVNRLEEMGLDEIGKHIYDLSNALSLMGVKTYFVGMNTELVKKMVLNRIQLNADAFSTFQAALAFLMKEKGLEFKKIEA